jgi:hypothetical protein
MALTKPGHARRPVIITGRKYAATAPAVVHRFFGVEPPDRVGPIVATFGSESSWKELIVLYSAFLENASDLAGLPLKQTDMSTMENVLSCRGFSYIVRPRRVHRLRSSENTGYPLRRTLLVTFKREKGHVTADLREIASILSIQGIGPDEDSAFRDLERRFDELVREKVRVPPHVKRPQDELIRTVVNHLVDWEQFQRQNPTPRLLFGRVIDATPFGPAKIQWLLGPQGIQNETAPLPWQYRNAYFSALHAGDWFRGVVLEFPEGVHWIEPPAKSPDPTDPANRKAAWDAIPRFEANEPDAWPVKAK